MIDTEIDLSKGFLNMKRVLMLFIALLIVSSVSVGVSSAQSEELSPITFTLYRDEESLTFYFSGADEIPFHNIRIDVFLPNGDVNEIYLQDYATFETLLIRRALQAPTCLRLELRDSNIPFPDNCRRLSSQQRRVEDNIGRSGIFWYEDEINEYFALELYQEDVFIGDCAADLVEDEVCEVTFVPSAMPEYVPPTPRPTATEPTIGSAPPRATSAPTLVTSSHPCPATISSSYGTAIQDLRPPNNASASAGGRLIIRAGTEVRVLAPATIGVTPLFRISDVSGRELGWISTIYVVLSPTCPE